MVRSIPARNLRPFRTIQDSTLHLASHSMVQPVGKGYTIPLMAELPAKLTDKVSLHAPVHFGAVVEIRAHAKRSIGIPMSYGYGSAIPPVKPGGGPCKQVIIIRSEYH